MKLFYSQNSPYARIARIAVLESGRSDVEMVRVETRTPDSPVLPFNPLGRVPTLVDGKLVLGEARNIWRYLAGSGNPEQTAAGSWQVAACESVVLGFLDGIATWVREIRRDPPLRSAFLVEVERQRAVRCLAFFEQRVEDIAGQPRGFAQAALACALDLMDYHCLVEDWEVDYRRLFLWLDSERARPAMKATKPSGQGWTR